MTSKKSGGVLWLSDAAKTKLDEVLSGVEGVRGKSSYSQVVELLVALWRKEPLSLKELHAFEFETKRGRPRSSEIASVDGRKETQG